MENKRKSFVVTVTTITESSDLTIRNVQTNTEKEIHKTAALHVTVKHKRE
ncbi:hypothetical protein [Bacillus toyonensis]|nr:hypothetical protein [Bacillus toyonensis]